MQLSPKPWCFALAFNEYEKRRVNNFRCIAVSVIIIIIVIVIIIIVIVIVIIIIVICMYVSLLLFPAFIRFYCKFNFV